MSFTLNRSNTTKSVDSWEQSGTPSPVATPKSQKNTSFNMAAVDAALTGGAPSGVSPKSPASPQITTAQFPMDVSGSAAQRTPSIRSTTTAQTTEATLEDVYAHPAILSIPSF